MSKTKDTEFTWVDTDPGVKRRILAEKPEAMTVEFAFQKDAVGALHHHVHIQTTYVASGTFDFTVGDETIRLETGQSTIIPSDVVHGCTCVEAGSLIDTFAPRRDDFL